MSRINWVKRYGSRSRLPWNIIDLIMASLFINVLSLALPITLLQVYDRILPNSSANTLVFLIIGIGIALLLEMILRLMRSLVSSWIGARFEHLTGSGAIERMVRADATAFERVGSGVHLERINSLGTLKDFYAGQAIITLLDIPFAVVFIAVVAYLAGYLAFVPITLMILFALSAQILGAKLRRSLDERNTADERRLNFIIEVLGGIHTVKSMAMEALMLRRYERLQESCAQMSHKVTAQSASAMNLGAFFSQVTMFAVVAFGATYVIDGVLTVGGLAACTLLSGRAMQPLQKAAGLWTRFQTISLARDKVQKLFALPAHQEQGLPAVDDFGGDIELDNVSFRYGKEAPEIINQLNLHVRPGETVGISGGNASGKSTLLYLMLGALHPTAGEVRFDGVPAGALDVDSLHSQLAYLPQQAVLFKGSILENVTMFRPELDDQARIVARLLGLDRVVSTMSQGYDTPVGDGATDALPRGIKQRVAIARALISNPKCLLFDEANAAMDAEGDQVLKALLERLKGQRTMVLVTLRPSLLELCDRLYNLENGQLVERSIESLRRPAAAPPQLEPKKDAEA